MSASTAVGYFYKLDVFDIFGSDVNAFETSGLFARFCILTRRVKTRDPKLKPSGNKLTFVEFLFFLFEHLVEILFIVVVVGESISQNASFCLTLDQTSAFSLL